MTLPLTAVRLVEGHDDLIEGLGMPFGGPLAGRDLTGWYFTPETDFAFDWFGPGERPALYDHGLDDGPGLVPIGRVAAWRMTDKGVWVRTQLDRAAEYFDAVKQLLTKKALGYSSGSVEHLATIRSDGRIERWPWIEQTLTPMPANPDARVYYSVPAEVATRHLVAIGMPDDALDAHLPSRELPAVDAETPTASDALPEAARDAGLAAVLAEAVTLHQAHMDGSEPTSAESQGRLAGLLEAALAFARAKEAMEAEAHGLVELTAESLVVSPTIQSIHDATRSLGAACGEESGEAEDSPPAPVLAIRAGDDVEPVSEADLARIADLLGDAATARARALLGMT